MLHGGEAALRFNKKKLSPYNNHNHYRGEELHDDGYFGPEPVVKCYDCDRVGHPDYANKCDQCGEYFCPDCDDLVEVDDTLMCMLCARDYRIDHPDMEEMVCQAEAIHDRLTDR